MKLVNLIAAAKADQHYVCFQDASGPAWLRSSFEAVNMKMTRRKAIITAALAPLALQDELYLSAENPRYQASELIGSWHVTSATNSVVLSIEPSGKVLFVLMQSGSFGVGRTNWKALPGGILVESYPRFRLWAGLEPNVLRAEIEDIPKNVDVSDSWRSFPHSFFMRRIADANIPESIKERPIPPGWSKEVLNDDWDKTAGKRRDPI